MMPDDDAAPTEIELRLEALDRAISFHAGHAARDLHDQDIILIARRFYAFLVEGEQAPEVTVDVLSGATRVTRKQ